MSVCRECCVLSGGALCDGLITRREESAKCGVFECGRAASISLRPVVTVKPLGSGGGVGGVGYPDHHEVKDRNM